MNFSFLFTPRRETTPSSNSGVSKSRQNGLGKYPYLPSYISNLFIHIEAERPRPISDTGVPLTSHFAEHGRTGRKKPAHLYGLAIPLRTIITCCGSVQFSFSSFLFFFQLLLDFLINELSTRQPPLQLLLHDDEDLAPRGSASYLGVRATCLARGTHL